MKKKPILLSVSVLIISLLVTACKNDKPSTSHSEEQGDDIMVIDGSSTVYPILKNAVEIYKQELADKKEGITVSFSGTNKGFEKLVSGEAQIIGASRPITAKEDNACKATDLQYIELLIAYDGIVIATNIKNRWASTITLAELKKLWSPEAQGKINSWKDINPKWPGTPIHLCGAGKNSGTYDYFTEMIVGEARKSREDYAASEDDNNLVHQVSSDSLALGFFGYHYYIKNNRIINALKIANNNETTGIAPNDSTIKSGLYKPLSRPLFLYVSKESLNKESVKKFLNYFADNIESFVHTSEYISPSAAQLSRIKEKLDKQTTGSDYLRNNE
ncbi:MAG TPA: phosphate ABC transporter substrate-binding protein PstS family protein [Cytophagaceae bacterium]|jgi:phosphate transport system substrate-binding protein|nr:phosphate ABC transporter substrate-binding protein PstS family protein [Cytophagaceae bacterium]